MKTAILGVATGYDRRALTPFVASLLKSGYAGDTWLFISEGDRALAEWLQKNGIHTIEVSSVQPYAAEFTPAAHSVPAEHPGTSPHVRRYFMYQLFLNTVGRDYDLFLLTDTRDVAFQKDPFDFPRADAEIWFVQEDKSKVIGTCHGNSLWMKNAFGDKGLEELKNKSISCSGTTFGTRKGIEAYLDKLLKLALSRKVIEIGGDQAIHNYIVYKDPLAKQHVFENEDGPVLTLHWKSDATFRIEPDGTMKNDHGGVPTILHQYDRHPALVHLVERKYCGPVFYASQRIRRAYKNRLYLLKSRLSA